MTATAAMSAVQRREEDDPDVQGGGREAGPRERERRRERDAGQAERDHECRAACPRHRERDRGEAPRAEDEGHHGEHGHLDGRPGRTRRWRPIPG